MATLSYIQSLHQEPPGFSAPRVNLYYYYYQ